MAAAEAIASMPEGTMEARLATPRAGGREDKGALPVRSEHQGDRVAEMQRRRLLMAALDIAGKNGLEGATVGAICRRAGVSRRTFYDMFEDRQSCYVVALDVAIEDLASELAGAWRSGARWRERVRAALAALLSRFEHDRPLARLCLVESLKGGPAVLERRREALDRLASLVDLGRAEGRSEPPELTAETVVGGVSGVLQARALESGSVNLLALLNPLMSMIVQPYLGAAAARRELEQEILVGAASEQGEGRVPARAGDVFEDLPIRITFRTAQVLETIGSNPGASNRDVAAAAGMADQGQASKLLRRLQGAELIENQGRGQARGEPNAWKLTPRGSTLLETVGSTKR